MFTTRRVGLTPRTMFPTLIRDFSIHSRPKVRSVRSKAAITESGETATADTSGPIQSLSISSKRQVICRPMQDGDSLAGGAAVAAGFSDNAELTQLLVVERSEELLTGVHRLRSGRLVVRGFWEISGMPLKVG